VEAKADAGATYTGYDPTQYAYRFAMNAAKPSARVSFSITPPADAKAIRPVFVVTGWGDREAKVTLGGKALAQGTDVRTGLVQTLEGTDLIVTLGIDLAKQARIAISG
jgi:hypothetical protein